MGDDHQVEKNGRREQLKKMSLADWGILIGILVGVGGLIFTGYEVMVEDEPTPGPTIAPVTVVAITQVPPTAPPTEAPPPVQIRFVECGEGEGAEGEFVELVNVSEADQDISRWRIEDEKQHSFTFEEQHLAPGATLKVWTDGVHTADNDLVWGRAAVWNDDHDVATLRNRQGEVVHTFSYP